MGTNENQIILQGISSDELIRRLTIEVDTRIEKLVSEYSSGKTVYLTRQQVAELLSVSVNTIGEWSARGVLQPYRLGRRVYFKLQEIDLGLKRV